MTNTIQQPALLIGLTGVAGSGKDTVAELLQSHWEQAGIASTSIGFADPIRAMVRVFLIYSGVQEPDRYLLNRQLKEEIIPEVGVSYRHLAQTLGTEWGQQCIGRDVWIKLLDQRFKACRNEWGATNFVMTDARFTVEADWVRAQGGVIWRIERPGVAPVREHVSEMGTIYIKSDRVIINDGTLDELRAQVGAELARLNYERGVMS